MPRATELPGRGLLPQTSSQAPGGRSAASVSIVSLCAPPLAPRDPSRNCPRMVGGSELVCLFSFLGGCG
eukprot:263977-Rhodomonas_salina.9